MQNDATKLAAKGYSLAAEAWEPADDSKASMPSHMACCGR